MTGTTPLPVGAGTPARRRAGSRWRWRWRRNELRLVLRRGEGLLVTFVIPAGVLLVFSSFDTTGGTGAGQPVDRAAARLDQPRRDRGDRSCRSAITTGYERAYGVLKRLGGSPAGVSVVVAAKTASVILVEVVQLVLLVGIAVGVLGFVAGPTASVAARARRRSSWARSRSPGSGCCMAGTLRAEATLALANLLFLAVPRPGRDRPAARPPAGRRRRRRRRSCRRPLLTQALAIGLGTSAADATGPMLLLAGWAAVFAVLAPAASAGTEATGTGAVSAG